MYTVTRQHYWGVEEKDAYVVEVSAGGFDYCNPDALVSKYSGEGEEYEDPREAVEVAIQIVKDWRRDGEKRAKIGIGATGGYTMPFDPTTFADAKKWAEKEYESLEKCAGCDTVIEDAKEWYQAGTIFKDGEFLPYEDGYKYCSERCAEKASGYEEEEE